MSAPTAQLGQALRFGLAPWRPLPTSRSRGRKSSNTAGGQRCGGLVFYWFVNRLVNSRVQRHIQPVTKEKKILVGGFMNISTPGPWKGFNGRWKSHLNNSLYWLRMF